MRDFNAITPILLGILFVLGIWGFSKLIDWGVIEYSIESKTPIVPEIKLVVENNVIDTIYVYRHHKNSQYGGIGRRTKTK